MVYNARLARSRSRAATTAVISEGAFQINTRLFIHFNDSMSTANSNATLLLVVHDCNKHMSQVRTHHAAESENDTCCTGLFREITSKERKKKKGGGWKYGPLGLVTCPLSILESVKFVKVQSKKTTHHPKKLQGRMKQMKPGKTKSLL